MPIYAYRCESCGFGKDVLQKMSDPQLTQCPECGKDTFRKQVTAAGFQLKGSGWYVTDFRGGNNAGKKDVKDDAKVESGDKVAGAGSDKPAEKGGEKAADKPADKPAEKSAAPSPAPAPGPSPTPPSSGS